MVEEAYWGVLHRRRHSEEVHLVETIRPVCCVVRVAHVGGVPGSDRDVRDVHVEGWNPPSDKAQEAVPMVRR